MIYCHILSGNFYSDFVNVNCGGVLGTELQSGNWENSAATSDIEDRVSVFYIFIKSLNAKFRCFVGTGAKSNAGVDFDKNIGIFFFFIFFPGWLDDDIVGSTKRFEKCFPVINPVFVFGFRKRNGSFSDFTERLDFLKNILYLNHDFFRVTVFRFHVKVNFCSPIVIFWVR